MKKAEKLSEIDYAVKFDMPVSPADPFFIDFSGVRGDFHESEIYKRLKVNIADYSFNYKEAGSNKTLLFLAGMRGSGKTSELSKYVTKLNKPYCFFCVTCNIDLELNLNDIEYMDILIFQLEKLVKQAELKGLLLKDEIIKSLQNWFTQKIEEVNSRLKAEGSSEIELKVSTPGFIPFLKIANTLKAAVSGTKERSTQIRSIMKNNFTDFAAKFNEFIEDVNIELRNEGIANEVLFIIDGLEKAMSIDDRKKIIIDESNRLRQIKANTIFTLPIELMKEQRFLEQFSEVVSFPFVKIQKKNGKFLNETAIPKFIEFVYKRIDESLFDSVDTVIKAIKYSGGSPRELLRILQYSNLFADDTKGKIDSDALDKAIRKLAAECAKYITLQEIEKLKQIKNDLAEGKVTPFDEIIQGLTEKSIVLEYNDGNYKRVIPYVEESDLYKQYVINNG